MVLKEERQGLEKKFFELSVKVVAEQGLQIYDMDYFPGSGEWRIFIFNEGTDTAVIEDCVRVDGSPENFQKIISLKAVIINSNFSLRNILEMFSSSWISLFLIKTASSQTKIHFFKKDLQ